ncbi:hypothetical protein ALC57_18168 [Trachymyrmex cornetzi]|uniref:Uncharacterized protein n=1 Tax=Trachymyrmex cornetzi TaxID=471704 RepID=A0A195D9T9_9HYME|nr:hypothetical protein ALC57_18168 [Trachymyrmex cornetzi]
MIQSYYTTGGPLTICAACMVLLANIDTVGMHYIKKHSINYIDALNGRSCTNCRVALYNIFPCNKLHKLKNYFLNSIVNDIISQRDMENMWEDRDDVKDVLNVLGNQRKRDVNGMRISPVQFLHDRELGIRGEKHGKVITEHVFDWSLLVRQRVYTWLREKAKNVHKNINVAVVKDDYY